MVPAPQPSLQTASWDDSSKCGQKCKIGSQMGCLGTVVSVGLFDKGQQEVSGLTSAPPSSSFLLRATFPERSPCLPFSLLVERPEHIYLSLSESVFLSQPADEHFSCWQQYLDKMGMIFSSAEFGHHAGPHNGWGCDGR